MRRIIVYTCKINNINTTYIKNENKRLILNLSLNWTSLIFCSSKVNPMLNYKKKDFKMSVQLIFILFDASMYYIWCK